MKSIVLYNLSDTQRVVATLEDGSVLLSKEWRKSPVDTWTIGKGGRIKNRNLIDLSDAIITKDESVLSEYEKATGERNDNFRNSNNYSNNSNFRKGYRQH